MKPIRPIRSVAVAVFLILTVSEAYAQSLSPRQLKRFKRVRHILQPLDDKSNEEAQSELIIMNPVEGHLRLQEIMAGTYRDLVGEFQINTALGRRQIGRAHV